MEYTSPCNLPTIMPFEVHGVCVIDSTLPPSLLNVGRQPVASGGSGDVYKGTLDDSKVCVKRVRVYSKDGPMKATKVHNQRHHFPRLPMLTRLTDALPGGCSVETLETQKHRPAPRHHSQSFPAHLRLDAWRGSDRIHQEVSRRRPTWSRGSEFCRVRSSAYSPSQLSGVAEGLHFLHSRKIVHGDLRGVCDCHKSTVPPC
jgi:hypothetical protein